VPDTAVDGYMLISDAPIESGKTFGPCLLGMSPNDWRFGGFDGAEWRCEDGFVVKPLVYKLLPRVSDVLQAQGGNRTAP
jgi:hypothetical protein